MKIFSLVMLFLILLVTFIAPAFAFDQNQYESYFSVVINNDSDTDFTGRILFPVNAKSLANGSYFDPARGDSVVVTNTYDSDSTLYSTAKDVENTNAYWSFGEVAVEAHSTATKFVWLGNLSYPTYADAEWLGANGDDVYIRDYGNSIDYNWGGIQITTKITVINLPSEDTPIFSKLGSYSLMLTSTGSLSLSAWKNISDSYHGTSATPSAVGDITQLTPSNSGSQNYQLVASGTDSTYVEVTASGTTSYDLYSLEGEITEGCKISNITVHYRANDSSGQNDALVQPVLYSHETGLVVGSGTDPSAAFDDYSEVITYESASGTPGGSDLQLGVKITRSVLNPASVKVSRLWADVTLTNPGTKYTVSIPVTLGSQQYVRGYVNVSSKLRLRDDTYDVNTPFTWSTETSYDDLLMFDADLSVKSLDLSCGATQYQDFDFNPNDIDSNTIYNQKTYEDIRYILNDSLPSGATVSITTLQFLGSEQSYPNHIGKIISDIDQPQMSAKNPEGTDSIFDPAADAFTDAYNFGGYSMSHHMFYLVMWIGALIFSMLWMNRKFPDHESLPAIAAIFVTYIFYAMGFIGYWELIGVGLTSIVFFVFSATKRSAL